mmetsp:Transcript_38699/g.84459  ORF Transcript_38699/g.84459 Transcript_38699/m.84459 type:complete len:94 (+) Transcript_38699:94-375(+)
MLRSVHPPEGVALRQVWQKANAGTLAGGGANLLEAKCYCGTPVRGRALNVASGGVFKHDGRYREGMYLAERGLPGAIHLSVFVISVGGIVKRA